MIGWIIAAAAVVLAHKAQASGTPTPSTTVTVGPLPTFGNVNNSVGLAPSREPVHTTIAEWQTGEMVPVPTGSRQDVLPPNPAAISDNVNSQIVGLREFVSGAATVRNPEVPAATGGTSGAVNIPSSGGASAPAGGTGGSTSFGGGGGFSGRGLPNTL